MQSLKNELICSTILVFLFSAGVIWIRTANIRATYEFNQKEAQLTQMKKTEQKFRIQLAKASSPQRLKEISQRIGLSAPKISQLYRFKGTP